MFLIMKPNTPRNSLFPLAKLIISVAIIGLLAAIAIPNFVRARTTAQQNACINNLRQIDGAKQQWAMEQRAGPGAAPVATDIDPYLGRGATTANILCPAGGSTTTFALSYTIGSVTNPPTCNIVSATHVLP